MTCIGTSPSGLLLACLLAASCSVIVADHATAEGNPGTEKASATSNETVPNSTSDAMRTMGREVFVNVAEPQCAVCHTLADAGSEGEIGPNLDELAPSAAQVHAAVTSGVGVMPSYDGVLTDEQIDAVSIYVASATNADTALD